MVAVADLIIFVLLVGGAFAVLQATGAITAGLARLVAHARKDARIGRLIIPVSMTLFSLGGAVFGMGEEAVPFVLIFVPMALSLGYDSLVGVAIPTIGAGAGFAGAFLNPFTVGIAQGIAGVPLFSGFGYRLVIWTVTTGLAIAFVMWHAHRVKRDPTQSPMYALDRVVHTPTAPEPIRAGAHTDVAAGSAEALPAFTRRHQITLVAFGGGLVVLVIGVTRLGWYIPELSALFTVLGVLMGITGGMSAKAIADGFIRGARDLVETALIIGLARGILVVMEEGRIIDTMLFHLASALDATGEIAAVSGMYAVQTILNTAVPSGSGQATLTMPLMAPLADLVGLSRQTAVLAYQLGDGFTNLIIPTNAVLMGSLSLGGIPWTVWARWILPLQIALVVAGLLFLVIPALGLFGLTSWLPV